MLLRAFRQDSILNEFQIPSYHSTAWKLQLSLYYTRRNVAGSGPFVMKKCSTYIIFQSVQGVYSTYKSSEFQKQKINVCEK
jgi:hypothetical protein